MKFSTVILPFIAAQNEGGPPAQDPLIITDNNGPPPPNQAAFSPPVTTPQPIKLNWPGNSPEDPCGSLTEINTNIINQTCAITYNFGEVPNVYRMFVGGGAFIVPNGTHQIITGIDGITNEDKVQILTFWEMEEDLNTNINNETCGDAAFFDLDCFENTLDTGLYFMETANDFRMAKGSNFNFQIAGTSAGQTVNIKLIDAAGTAFECLDFRSHGGIVKLNEPNGCAAVNRTFEIKLQDDETKEEVREVVDCPKGNIVIDLEDESFNTQVLHFECTQSVNQTAEPDLWRSTIVST